MYIREKIRSITCTIFFFFQIDEERIITLAYLVLHKENTAVLPEEIEEVLNKKNKKKVSLVALNFWLWVLLVRPTFAMLVVHDC